MCCKLANRLCDDVIAQCAGLAIGAGIGYFVGGQASQMCYLYE